MSAGYGRPVWAEIDLSSIRHNVTALRRATAEGARFCAVVKADGYGHGAEAVARQAVALGADYLAVAVLDEAAFLRSRGFTEPILILGYTPAYSAGAAVGLNVAQTVFDIEDARALSEAAGAVGGRARVHLKIDTGMGRLGVPPSEAAAFALAVSSLPNVEVEGMYTHFAKADSLDNDYQEKQFAAFKDALASVAEAGVRIPIRHCANSATIIRFKEAHLDMVRAGISLYGLWPSDEIAGDYFEHRPAMRLKARLAHIKNVPAGAFLSYGCTFETKRPSRIGTLPLGYADGWTRMLSGKAEVSIGG
ncbi:MAG: alanine racemase, partial [Deltaproteobacteria bacterium]|nr:alanine racemase [Deltaproteobacteria bacterium]